MILIKSWAVTLLFLSGFTDLVGQWQKQVIDKHIRIPISVDTADLDGDSRLDLVVAAFRDNELVWYRNNFPSWTKYTIDTAAMGITFAYCGDMDGNGTMDVVASLLRTGQLVWYENAHPTWKKHIINPRTEQADMVAIADINRDGSPDIVNAGNIVQGGDIIWYENRHPDWIRHVIEEGDSCYYGIYAFDLDRDGLEDLIGTMNKENKIVWFKNENKGLTWSKHIIDDHLVNACCIGKGDLDGSGNVDIVASSGGTYLPGDLLVWYKIQQTDWIGYIIDRDQEGITWPAITDMDHDGIQDIAVTVYEQNSVIWYQNRHPVWTKKVIDPHIYHPRVLMTADLNDDKRADLVVTADSCVVCYLHTAE